MHEAETLCQWCGREFLSHAEELVHEELTHGGELGRFHPRTLNHEVPYDLVNCILTPSKTRRHRG